MKLQFAIKQNKKELDSMYNPSYCIMHIKFIIVIITSLNFYLFTYKQAASLMTNYNFPQLKKKKTLDF